MLQSTSVYFEIPQITCITKLTLFGGNYGFGIAVPVGYVSVDVGITPVGIDRSASSFGLGDSILVPAIVGWHSGNWHTNLALSVFAPTLIPVKQPIRVIDDALEVVGVVVGCDVKGQLYTVHARLLTVLSL